MFNFRQTAKNSIRIFAIVVVAIQVVFAVIWIYANFGIMPKEHIALDYLSASKTLVVDDYMSILYALILFTIRPVVNTDTGLFCVLFILQFLAVFFSVWTFPVRYKTKVLIGMFLVTNPLILAGIGSLNVYAFSFASVMAAAGLLVRGEREIKTQDFVLFGLVSMLSLLFSPELIWFEAIILIPIALHLIGVQGKKIFTGIMLWLAAAVIAMGVNLFVPSPGAYGRATESAELYILQYLPGDDLYIYGERMAYYYNYQSMNLLQEIQYHDELIIHDVAVEIEGNSDADAAVLFYRHLISDYINRGIKRAITKTAKEVGMYSFPLVAIPVIYETLPSGTHLSWNVTNFIRQTPEVSRLYLFFGITSSLLLSVYSISSGLIFGNAARRKIILGKVLIVVCLGIWCVFCNFKGFDYRLCPIAVTIFPVSLYITEFEEKLNYE